MQRQQRWIDYTGLNLIRIVIGSYFMAICLGLIEGSDPRILFMPFLAPQTADLVTTVMLFAITTAFMIGLYLRLTSLMLAIFMLASSYVTNFITPETVRIGDFWRDLTLVCAVLLCYSCLKRNEVRKAALVWRRRTERISDQETVMPRRVYKAAQARTRPRETSTTQIQASLEPLIRRPRPVVARRAHTDETPRFPVEVPQEPRPEIQQRVKKRVRQVEDDDDDLPDNIFLAM